MSSQPFSQHTPHDARNTSSGGARPSVPASSAAGSGRLEVAQPPANLQSRGGSGSEAAISQADGVP